MATIVFGVIGAYVSSLGGFWAIVAGTVIAAAGAYIDSQIVFPAIFGKPEIDNRGPAIDDLSIQTGTEGASINFCLGALTRVAGNVIWMSDLIEEVTTTSQGGKGGGGGVDVTERTYFVHVAVGVCEGVVQTIPLVLANGKPLLIGDDPVTIQGNDITGSFTLSGYGYYIRRRITFIVPIGGTDVSAIVGGVTLQVSGFSNNNYNGSFKVSSVETHATVIQIITTRNLVGQSTNPAGDAITIVVTHPLHSDVQVTRLTVYPGTATQLPDPLIQAEEGLLNTPAYRNLCYAVFEKLRLSDFGNQLPNLHFQVQQADLTTFTYGDAITAILDRVRGFNSSDYDVTDLDGICKGYNFSGRLTPMRIIETLLLAQNATVKEQNGKLIFLKTDSVDTPIIKREADLAAHVDGGEAPQKFVQIDAAGFLLPDEINVNYVDENNDLQRGSQRERLINHVTRSAQAVDVPVTMNAEQARSIAKRILWRTWTRRVGARFSLPPSYIDLEETDILTLTSDDETYRVMITEIVRGANFETRISGHVLGVSKIDDSSEGEDGTGGTGTIYVPPETLVQVLDGPALRDQDTVFPGVYFVQCAIDPAMQWQGGGMYVSNNDSSYSLFGPTSVEGKMGITLTQLGLGPISQWDHHNTVTVRMSQGILSSSTDDLVLQGANRMFIGREVIAYVVATPTGQANTYVLSRLLRGLRDTPERVHTGIEIVVAIEGGGGFNFKGVNLSAIHTTRFYRGVSLGQDVLDEETDVQLTLEGGTIRPFSPVHLQAKRSTLDWDGEPTQETPNVNDWSLKWVRRTRAIARILSETPTPNLDIIEVYEVDIIDEAGVVKRTIIVEDMTQLVYTSTQQIADHGSIPVGIHAVVYKMSPVVGRGKGATLNERETTPALIGITVPDITRTGSTGIDIDAAVSISIQLPTVTVSGAS